MRVGGRGRVRVRVRVRARARVQRACTHAPHLAAQLLVHQPEDLRHGRRAALVLGEVAAHGAHAHAVRRLELRPRARRLLVVAAVREHAVEALRRQPVRRREPDSAGAARDDGDCGGLRGAVHRSGAARAAVARQRRDERRHAARERQEESEPHCGAPSCSVTRSLGVDLKLAAIYRCGTVGGSGEPASRVITGERRPNSPRSRPASERRRHCRSRQG